MPNDTGVVEASPEIVAQATAMGWIPPEKWTSDKPHVDAATFVANGLTKLPILHQRISSLQEDIKKRDKALADLQADTRLLTEQAYNEGVATWEAQLAEAKARKAQAVSDGDGDAANKADDDIDAIKAAKPVKPKKDEPAADADNDTQEIPPEIKAELEAWKAENPWYVPENPAFKVAQAAARMLAELAQAEGKQLVGRALADATSEYMEEHHPKLIGKKDVPVSGNEGSRTRNTGTRRRDPNAKTFENLPKAVQESFNRGITNKLLGLDRSKPGHPQTPEAIAKAKANFVNSYDWE